MADSTGLAKTYQHKTDIEHVLSSPDTYTGSMEAASWTAYVLRRGSEGTPEVRRESIVTIPGLFKCFDEGLVNCRDHQVRMAQAITDGKPDACKVSKIEITIDDDGTITMLNDGDGIDVAKHPELGVWIPEMVFGRLRTSTNYDKSKKKR